MRRFLALISIIGFGGCVASHQSVVEDVDMEEWSAPVTVAMPNSDTTTMRDLNIFVRYQPSQTPASFGVVIESIAPDSTSYSEEVTINLDRHTNNRHASRLSIRPYRTNVVWRQKGEYTINITPTTKVAGVEAVGLNITRTEI